MNCPVCDRSLAPTLSICPSCGAMMNDTVREELQTKITPGIVLRPQPRAEKPVEPVSQPPLAPAPRPNLAPPQPPVRRDTAGLATPKTSPTLVGFQNKNAPLPEWRLQLQNAVQQRKGVQARPADSQQSAAHFPINGAAAMLAEPVARAEATPEVAIGDLRVANAMRRIEQSRKTFQDVEAPPKPRPQAQAAAPQRPFNVVAPNTMTASAGTAAAPARVAPAPKPTLVVPAPISISGPLKRDTNKLPKIEMTPGREVEQKVSQPLPTIAGEKAEFPEIKRIHIKADHPSTGELAMPNAAAEEIEDLAPFSMRFSAGLFDLIIGGFASMLLLSPIAFTSNNWFSSAGLLTMAGTLAIVMFVYMTLCLGFLGKTMGMRLFSLELVDAVENEYPTLQQAAISSSIFLISLMFAGAGFLTVFFNEENRALHDLLSGTILVREF